MLDFDFTPIWMATLALSLYYSNIKISAKCHHIENGRRGICEIWIKDKDGSEQSVDSFVVPVDGIETDIEYGDYIRTRLEQAGYLPAQ